MKILLLCVGKLRSDALKVMADEYSGRMKHYGGLEILEVKAATAREPREIVKEESERLLAALKPEDTVWILDERGKQFTSTQIAERFTDLENKGTRRLVVVLGGAFGFNAAVRDRGQKWALSALTFNHELCRVIVLEQLYRARTIQRKEPYHHGDVY